VLITETDKDPWVYATEMSPLEGVGIWSPAVVICGAHDGMVQRVYVLLMEYALYGKYYKCNLELVTNAFRMVKDGVLYHSWKRPDNLEEICKYNAACKVVGEYKQAKEVIQAYDDKYS